jgi:hypothetical protein
MVNSKKQISNIQQPMSNAQVWNRYALLILKYYTVC